MSLDQPLDRPGPSDIGPFHQHREIDVEYDGATNTL
jgi:hypothetical protein